MEQFPEFDVVSDFSDHRLAVNTSNNLQRAATKAVMKEWKILQKNLPAGSIYVRAYEGRVDLLRAAIVGPQKTPYHDGLFFFDFRFPANYPHAPPSAHYWSYGLRLNPNLYENGHVCLSLLNTWYGPNESRWQPGVSTILQVLLSIQALVLNEAPLHNEPDPLLKLTKTWLSYNDTAFVLSCRTMLYLFHRPPNNFRQLLDQHFRARSRAILTACQVYLNGFARVGDYEYKTAAGCAFAPPFEFTTTSGENQRRRSRVQRISVSSGFQSSLKVQYGRLVIALSNYDPSLIQFSKELDPRVDIALDNSLPPPVSKVKLLFRKLFQWMHGVSCTDARTTLNP